MAVYSPHDLRRGTPVRDSMVACIFRRGDVDASSRVGVAVRAIQGPVGVRLMSSRAFCKRIDYIAGPAGLPVRSR